MMLPVYLQIKDALAQCISQGELAPGDLMPSETELMKTWSVSRITVRNAIKELAREGLIYTVHGKGSFVSQPPITNTLPSLNSYSHDVVMQGMQPGSRVLELVTRPASKDIASRLLIPPAGPVLYFSRLHLANGQPVSLTYTHLPLAVLGPAQQFFTAESLANHSLYSLLEKVGFMLTGGEQLVSAVNATPEQARLLEVKARTALIYSERTAFTRDRVPVEHTQIVSRPDRTRWKIKLGPMEPSQSQPGPDGAS